MGFFGSTENWDFDFPQSPNNATPSTIYCGCVVGDILEKIENLRNIFLPKQIGLDGFTHYYYGHM